VRLLQLSQDPENGPAEFAVPIEADPGLAGQVLRFVNSSYFGFAREVSNVKLAIALVGVRTVKNFVLWSAVFSVMPNPRCGPFELKSLWVDSLRRGVFARQLGKRLGIRDIEELFSAALLQDMAIPLLAKDLNDCYRKLLEDRDLGRQRLSKLEKQRFGWTHAEASALMARQWSLPERIAEMISSHAEVGSLKSGELDRPAACVACSALLPSSTDASWAEQTAFLDAYHRLSGEKNTDIGQLLADIDREFEDFSAVLKLGTSARPLVSSLSAWPAPATVVTG
jgi:HD-like signal output (HDOD) protein